MKQYVCRIHFNDNFSEFETICNVLLDFFGL
jgi:hypothetical protein